MTKNKLCMADGSGIKLGLVILFIFLMCVDFSSLKAQDRHAQKKPKNVIFMIGDGMGLSQISAALVCKEGDLNLARFKKIGFIKTNSSDNFITDSAAGATAFSIGEKTYNGAIGLDSLKNPKPTLIELAENKGLRTGMVVTCAMTHATPASFAAHAENRKLEYEIAEDFTNVDLEVMMGGGQRYFTNRKDGKNLLDTLRKKGYEVLDSTINLENIASSKFYAFSNYGHNLSMTDGRGNYSEKASLKAVEVLNESHSGFFLIVEGSQIDWGGHDNNSDYIISEMLDFDATIGKVLDWAQKDGNTLVVVTADHETGGYALNGGSVKEKKVQGAFTTVHHTGSLVPVFAYGPGADQFTGIYENTEIFHKIVSLLKLKAP